MRVQVYLNGTPIRNASSIHPNTRSDIQTTVIQTMLLSKPFTSTDSYHQVEKFKRKQGVNTTYVSFFFGIVIDEGIRR